MQSKIESLKESLAHIVLGYIISLIGNAIILPILNIQINIQQNLLIGVFFTFIGILKTYIIRRHFNKKENR